MKNFAIVWSSLLLVIIVGCYFVSLAIFTTPWFAIGALISLLGFFKLVSLVGIYAKALKPLQRHELVCFLHRHGLIFLLISIACASYVMMHSLETNIISTALGIACFCIFTLSHALRNFLGS